MRRAGSAAGGVVHGEAGGTAGGEATWRFPGAAVEQGLLYYYYARMRPAGAFVTPHGCTANELARWRLGYHFFGQGERGRW